MAEQWFCNFPDGLESASTLIRANLFDDGAADTPGHPKLPVPCSGFRDGQGSANAGTSKVPRSSHRH